MDPTQNEFQLAFIDLSFAVIQLFFNVITNIIFPAVNTPFLTNVFDVLQQIFGPLFM